MSSVALSSSISVTEIQITSPNASYHLSKKLEVFRSPDRHPLPLLHQGQTGQKQTWRLDPPILVTREDSFVLKIKVYRKWLRVQVAGPSVKFASWQFMDVYSSGATAWTHDIGEGLEMTIHIAGHGPLPGGSSRQISRTRSAAGTVQSSVGTIQSSVGTGRGAVTGENRFEVMSTQSVVSDLSFLPDDPDAPLPSTADDILSRCPRFRILVIGKSGVGKSSLINRTFGVTQASVSEDKPGVSDINFEITSSANTRFVLHDSQGFEHGERKNLETVQKFIKERSRKPLLKDRLHAIWLCTETPSTGGRVFEYGDEIFLSQPIDNVPVIVVFTKYDLLVRDKDYELDDPDPPIPEDERRRIVMDQAEASFREDCVNSLHAISPKILYAKASTKPEYRHMLEDLVSLTFESVRERVDGVVSLTTGIAQRVSTNVKISTSIAVGKKRYWLAILASTDFPGRRLSTCLEVIHRDLVTVWNFQDPNSYLLSSTVRAAMRQLMEDMINHTPARSTTNSSTANNAALLTSSPLAASFGSPIPISIGFGAGVAAWLSQVYERSHETVRCLMSYVVDLTLIMKLIFEDQDEYLTIDPLIFRDSFDRYDLSTTRLQNHAAITAFVENLSFRDRTSSSRVVSKIEELVWTGSVQLSTSSS